MIKNNIIAFRNIKILIYRTQSACLVCLGFLSYGIMLTWTSPMLPKLMAGNSTLRVTPDEGSWIVSVASFGGLSAPLIGHMSNNYGRKPMLIVTAIPLIANFIIILVATSPAHIIVAQGIAGVGLTSIYVIGPVYMGEVLHQQFRGMLGKGYTLSGLSCHKYFIKKGQ